MAKKKAKSPYSRKQKVPFKYSNLKGVEHQRMLVDTFGPSYWVRTDENGMPVRDRDTGRPIRMFPAEAYR